MVKIGLLGAGHLGKIHLKLLKNIPNITLVGFFDTNSQHAEQVSDETGLRAFGDMASLIAAADAIDITTPTVHHYHCAKQALEAGRHIFIEKPITHTLEEAEKLIALAEAHQLKAQVGHVERFNPALQSIEDLELRPLFIEGHRLAQYNPRGTDVSVVLDLMIHDLDVVLKLVDSPIQAVSANGVAVVSDSPDIANARISFENGCVANLTASRISLKNMRRLRFFQPNAYVAVDFLEKQTEIVQLHNKPPAEEPGHMTMTVNTGKAQKHLSFRQLKTSPNNAIRMELEAFARAIEEDHAVPVSLKEGYDALKAAYEVAKQIEQARIKGVG